jgi:hypothetical protein
MPKHNSLHTAPAALPFCISCYHPPSCSSHTLAGIYVHILLNLSLLMCVNLTLGWATGSFSRNTQLSGVFQLVKLDSVHEQDCEVIWNSWKSKSCIEDLFLLGYNTRVCWKSIDISEVHVTSVLRVEEEAKQETGMKQVANKVNCVAFYSRR